MDNAYTEIGRIIMSKNEKIAKWLGWQKNPNSNLWITPDGGIVLVRRWDENINEWRGDNGLLAAIEKAGPSIWYDFIAALITNMGPRSVIVRKEDGSEWVEVGTVLTVIESSPAQLAEALISVIDKSANHDDIVTQEAINLVWGGENDGKTGGEIVQMLKDKFGEGVVDEVMRNDAQNKKGS